MPATGVRCRVVPHAARPEGTMVAAVTVAAVWLQAVVVVPVPLLVDASNLMVTDVGTTPVRVLEVRFATTPRFTV